MTKISMSLWVQTNAQLKQGTVTQTFFQSFLSVFCAVFKWQYDQGAIYALATNKGYVFSLIDSYVLRITLV